MASKTKLNKYAIYCLYSAGIWSSIDIEGEVIFPAVERLPSVKWNDSEERRSVCDQVLANQRGLVKDAI